MFRLWSLCKHLTVISGRSFMLLSLVAAINALQADAQCIEHPYGKTALILNNQTSYDLTFFIDDIDRGIVKVGKQSAEIEIIPGQHLLGARAMIQGQGFWSMVVNEVLNGQLCTWTVMDPKDDSPQPRLALELAGGRP